MSGSGVSGEEDSAVRRAIEGFGLRVEEVLSAGESFSSTVRRLRLDSGEQVFLKIPWNRLKLDRECAALRALSECPLTPRLLDAYAADDHFALLMSQIPGEPLSPAADFSPALATSMGEALALLHETVLPDPEPGTVPPPVPDLARRTASRGVMDTVRVQHGQGWWEELHGLFAQFLGHCRAHEPHDDWDRAERAVAQAIEGAPVVGDPRLVHFDFRPGNLLQTADRISGVLDFESTRPGLPTMDFVKVAWQVWQPRPDLRSPWMTGYARVRPVPDDLETRLPLYELYHAVGGVAWSHKRGQPGTEFHALNRAAVSSILPRLRC